jgi:type IV pilus assembly protein PilX
MLDTNTSTRHAPEPGPHSTTANRHAMQTRPGHCPARRSQPPAPLRKQSGISLVVVLLFLVILTLLGLSASLSSTSGERMARNARDQNVALQAAEAALRDARTDILTKRRLSGRTGATLTCDAAGFKGFCLPHETTGDKPVWDLYLEDASRSVEVGEIPDPTGTIVFKMPLNGPGGVAHQPRYLIEPIPDNLIGGSLKAGAVQFVYRVTALGYGANENTKVVVQEVVRF